MYDTEIQCRLVTDRGMNVPSFVEIERGRHFFVLILPGFTHISLFSTIVHLLIMVDVFVECGMGETFVQVVP